jgi:hypothetical protein
MQVNDEIPLSVVEAATADKALDEEISWEQLQEVDELGPAHSPGTSA